MEFYEVFDQRSGEVVARYAPATEPEKLPKDIKKELEKVEK